MLWSDGVMDMSDDVCAVHEGWGKAGYSWCAPCITETLHDSSRDIGAVQYLCWSFFFATVESELFLY